MIANTSSSLSNNPPLSSSASSSAVSPPPPPMMMIPPTASVPSSLVANNNGNSNAASLATRYPSIARVEGSYQNEFALAASSEVVAITSFALSLACLVPSLSWALVPTTTGPVMNAATNVTYYPITVEEWSLFADSCGSPGMKYTYDSGLCDARYQVVAAFAVLTCVMEILATFFGLMPFSPVAPREPKRALTHAMLSGMMGSLFALITWTVFYGSLVFGVWASPNKDILTSGIPWTVQTTVTYGGFISVSAWVGSFIAWVLSLSAMIKYDAVAAEQAIVDHRSKKEERKRRKALLIARLGEGAARAAREGIPLELGDKLYLGGTIAAGSCSAIAWANLGVVPFVLDDPRAFALTGGALMIVVVIASLTASVVLLMGLVDLVPRPKASVGGFAVFCVVTALWISDFGMALAASEGNNIPILKFEIAIGTIGVACVLGTTVVLYHPFKIWERSFSELPRPSKVHEGGQSTMALVISCAAFALMAMCLFFGGVSSFTYSPPQFVGYIGQVPTSSPTTGSSKCPDNTQGKRCNVGPPEDLFCCVDPLVCFETAYTTWTCEKVPFTYDYYTPRTMFPVGQAFLALSLAGSIITYVFAMIANAPNGVMVATPTSLAISFGFGFAQFTCGTICFSVFQAFIVEGGGSGMPNELGYILGGTVSSLVCSICGLMAWLSYQNPGGVRSLPSTTNGSNQQQHQSFNYNYYGSGNASKNNSTGDVVNFNNYNPHGNSATNSNNNSVPNIVAPGPPTPTHHHGQSSSSQRSTGSASRGALPVGSTPTKRKNRRSSQGGSEDDESEEEERDELYVLQRDLEIERLKYETAKLRRERMELEKV